MPTRARPISRTRPSAVYPACRRQYDCNFRFPGTIVCALWRNLNLLEGGPSCRETSNLPGQQPRPRSSATDRRSCPSAIGTATIRPAAQLRSQAQACGATHVLATYNLAHLPSRTSASAPSARPLRLSFPPFGILLFTWTTANQSPMHCCSTGSVQH